MRILIADDDQLVAEGVAGILEALGHQAAIATGPAEALSEICTSSWDLVMVDLHMPAGGGERLLSQLGRDGVPAVRSVVLTGDAAWWPRPGDAVQAPVLHKPFSLAEMKAVLESVSTAPGNGVAGR